MSENRNSSLDMDSQKPKSGGNPPKKSQSLSNFEKLKLNVEKELNKETKSESSESVVTDFLKRK